MAIGSAGEVVLSLMAYEARLRCHCDSCAASIADLLAVHQPVAYAAYIGRRTQPATLQRLILRTAGVIDLVVPDTMQTLPRLL